jgi:hypothetical protein
MVATGLKGGPSEIQDNLFSRLRSSQIVASSQLRPSTILEGSAFEQHQRPRNKLSGEDGPLLASQAGLHRMSPSLRHENAYDMVSASAARGAVKNVVVIGASYAGRLWPPSARPDV